MINAITSQAVKVIDPARESDAEPALDELFLEWRTSAARGIKAPHDVVRALFAQALGGSGQEAVPDFGVTGLRSRAARTLGALAPQRNPGRD